ncbi:MAG: hypothetical protein HY695_38280 [Deltaproteobacteria bacterium]|nr:hypothetical protein [Deltaproteobacteria bacterium]
MVILMGEAARKATLDVSNLPPVAFGRAPGSSTSRRATCPLGLRVGTERRSRGGSIIALILTIGAMFVAWRVWHAAETT